MRATFSLILAMWATAATGGDEQHSYVPPAGFVSEAKTAVAIAAAVLGPIYGDEAIRRQQPLFARLDGDIWTITGTLPRGFLGGVALIQIAKKDGRIVRVSHGK